MTRQDVVCLPNATSRCYGRCSMVSTGTTLVRSCPTSPPIACSRLPADPIPGGRRFAGKDEVRRGLAARFQGIPDVRYGDDDHFACGARGVSEWTLSGTTVDGEHIEVRGCDLWTFEPGGKIVRKDSFWKIRAG